MDSDRQGAEVGVKAAGVTSRLTPPIQIAAPFREGYFVKTAMTIARGGGSFDDPQQLEGENHGEDDRDHGGHGWPPCGTNAILPSGPKCSMNRSRFTPISISTEAQVALEVM